MSKPPREFWIEDNVRFCKETDTVRWCRVSPEEDHIHVIEKSAYDELKAAPQLNGTITTATYEIMKNERDKLTAALKVAKEYICHTQSNNRCEQCAKNDCDSVKVLLQIEEILK